MFIYLCFHLPFCNYLHIAYIFRMYITSTNNYLYHVQIFNPTPLYYFEIKLCLIIEGQLGLSCWYCCWYCCLTCLTGRGRAWQVRDRKNFLRFGPIQISIFVFKGTLSGRSKRKAHNKLPNIRTFPQSRAGGGGAFFF